MILTRSATVFLAVNYKFAPKNTVTNGVRSLLIKKCPVVRAVITFWSNGLVTGGASRYLPAMPEAGGQQAGQAGDG